MHGQRLVTRGHHKWIDVPAGCPPSCSLESSPSGWRPAARPSPSSPAGAGAGADIVIGASLELTGPSAVSGQAEERALRIAADMINERGVVVDGTTRRIRLVVRDNAGDPADRGDLDVDPHHLDNAVAVVAGGTTASVAMAPVAESLRVPMLSIAAADGVTLPFAERRYAFTLAPKASDVAAEMFRHLVLDEEVHRVALLAAAGPHGDGGVGAVQVAANTAGVVLGTVARFSPGGDLAAPAQQVSLDAPDAVVVWSDGDSAGPISTQLRSAGYAGRIIFDPGAVGQAVISRPRRHRRRRRRDDPPRRAQRGPGRRHHAVGAARQRFVDRYVQLHQSLPGYAPYAADAVGLIAEAAGRARSHRGRTAARRARGRPVRGHRRRVRLLHHQPQRVGARRPGGLHRPERHLDPHLLTPRPAPTRRARSPICADHDPEVMIGPFHDAHIMITGILRQRSSGNTKAPIMDYGS